MNQSNRTRKLALAGLLTARRGGWRHVFHPIGAASARLCSTWSMSSRRAARPMVRPGLGLCRLAHPQPDRHGQPARLSGLDGGRAAGGPAVSEDPAPACGLVGEVVGTGILGAMLSYPVAVLLMGKTSALFAFVPSFMINTVAGSIVAVLVLCALERTHILRTLRAGCTKKELS